MPVEGPRRWCPPPEAAGRPQLRGAVCAASACRPLLPVSGLKGIMKRGAWKGKREGRSRQDARLHGDQGRRSLSRQRAPLGRRRLPNVSVKDRAPRSLAGGSSTRGPHAPRRKARLKSQDASSPGEKPALTLGGRGAPTGSRREASPARSARRWETQGHRSSRTPRTKHRIETRSQRWVQEAGRGLGRSPNQSGTRGRQSRGPEAGLGRGQPGAVSPWRHDARDSQMRLKGPGGRALPPVATLPLTAR